MKLFQKPLTLTDIEKRLAVPTASLPQLGFANGQENHFVDLLVKDNSTERLWQFRCSTRLTGNHPKPYLSSGWLDFVRDKGLAIKDVIHLYKEEDEVTGAHYRIKVERQIQVLGKLIWAEVY